MGGHEDTSISHEHKAPAKLHGNSNDDHRPEGGDDDNGGDDDDGGDDDSTEDHKPAGKRHESSVSPSTGSSGSGHTDTNCAQPPCMDFHGKDATADQGPQRPPEPVHVG